MYEPILGEKLDILQKAFSEMEADIVRAAFANSHGSADVGASYQEEIKSTYHIIVYNMYLKEQDLAQKPILQLDIDYYIGSAEGHEYPNLQVGDEV
ncbi:MAG: hypothetical protein LUO83_04880, partial [Methanothrix sp.]|nr:hypothetical protein [Methanothrix sp.]